MTALTFENLLLLTMIVVPGFVANQVYLLRCPSQKSDIDKQLPAFIAYSLFNLLIWAYPIAHVVIRTPQSEWVIWQISVLGLFVLFISPTALALTWVWLRKNYLHTKMRMDHPTPRGWDYFVENNGEFYILFHLKNGKMFGGYFGANSLAAKYPQEPEIYVEQVIRVDETGKFVEEVPGSLGAVIRQSEWERVEFFSVQREIAAPVAAERMNDGEGTEQRTTGAGPAGRTSGEPTEPEGRSGAGWTVEPASPTNPAPGWIGDSTADEPTKA